MLLYKPKQCCQVFQRSFLMTTLPNELWLFSVFPSCAVINFNIWHSETCRVWDIALSFVLFWFFAVSVWIALSDLWVNLLGRPLLRGINTRLNSKLPQLQVLQRWSHLLLIKNQWISSTWQLLPFFLPIAITKMSNIFYTRTFYCCYSCLCCFVDSWHII